MQVFLTFCAPDKIECTGTQKSFNVIIYCCVELIKVNKLDFMCLK